MGNMHRLSLSEIINKVIVDLISDAIIELMKQRNTMPKKVVVAFSGHAGLCYSSVFEQLRLLPDSTSVYLLFSHSATEDLSRQNIPVVSSLKNVQVVSSLTALHEQISDYDLLFLPELSLNSLAKSTLNIADNLVTELIQHALFKAKKVVATIDYVQQNSDINSSYQRTIQQQIARLASYNVDIISIGEVANTINTFCSVEINSDKQTQRADMARQLNCQSYTSSQTTGKVISYSHIRCHDPQQPLYLNSDTLVTPLAMDIIKQKNIRIIKR